VYKPQHCQLIDGAGERRTRTSLRPVKPAFHDTNTATSSRTCRATSPFSLPQKQLQEIALVGGVVDDPREDDGVGVDVGVVECELYYKDGQRWTKWRAKGRQ